MHEDGPDADLIRRGESPCQCIAQQGAAKPVSLLALINGKARDETNRDREVPGDAASHGSRGGRVVHLAGNQGVVGDDPRVGLRGDEGAGDITALRLSGVGLQPAVEARLPAPELANQVALGIERLDRPQIAHKGRTEGRALSRAKPASNRSGCESHGRAELRLQMPQRGLAAQLRVEDAQLRSVIHELLGTQRDAHPGREPARSQRTAGGRRIEVSVDDLFT